MQGAEYQGHWAFIAPKRPERADAGEGWAKNAIDDFIAARLAKEGLKPSAEADRATLIRRVTFDLTGLPPTPKEVDAFVNDKSPDAYAKVVERLTRLSPLRRAHGARLARRRPLRRHERLPHRQRPRHDALARMGHRRLQQEQALRPVHDRAARRRPAARRDARAEDRQRLQPQPHDQLRGRRDPGGVSHRLHRRSRQHDRRRSGWA